MSTLQQGDGSMNVFVGTGRHWSSAATTTARRDQQQPGGRSQGTGHPPVRRPLTVNVTQQMTGGSLGGLLRFRDEVLDESQNGTGARRDQDRLVLQC